MVPVHNVFLVGMMGSGKTTIGRELATLLHFDFHDTDQLVEGRAGADISWIFDKEASRASATASKRPSTKRPRWPAWWSPPAVAPCCATSIASACGSVARSSISARRRRSSWNAPGAISDDPCCECKTLNNVSMRYAASANRCTAPRRTSSSPRAASRPAASPLPSPGASRNMPARRQQPECERRAYDRPGVRQCGAARWTRLSHSARRGAAWQCGFAGTVRFPASACGQQSHGGEPLSRQAEAEPWRRSASPLC